MAVLLQMILAIALFVALFLIRHVNRDAESLQPVIAGFGIATGVYVLIQFCMWDFVKLLFDPQDAALADEETLKELWHVTDGLTPLERRFLIRLIRDGVTEDVALPDDCTLLKEGLVVKRLRKGQISYRIEKSFLIVLQFSWERHRRISNRSDDEP